MLRFGNRLSGVTLIELMIAVAIVAILAAVALPSYNQYIIKANRRAAQAEMLEIAVRERQFLIVNRGYADKATLVASGYSLPNELQSKYTFDVTPVASPPSFTITFAPIGTQATDGPLSLDSAGGKTPPEKW
jgi:type IV pilus assembly protein PilE